MPQDDVPTLSPAAEAYFARTRPAAEKLRLALLRRPDDTAAWDAHAAEVKAAWSEFARADPEAAGRMAAAGMDFVSRHSTPPKPDNRTEAQVAEDALHLR